MKRRIEVAGDVAASAMVYAALLASVVCYPCVATAQVSYTINVELPYANRSGATPWGGMDDCNGCNVPGTASGGTPTPNPMHDGVRTEIPAGDITIPLGKPQAMRGLDNLSNLKYFETASARYSNARGVLALSARMFQQSLEVPVPTSYPTTANVAITLTFPSNSVSCGGTSVILPASPSSYSISILKNLNEISDTDAGTAANKLYYVYGQSQMYDFVEKLIALHQCLVLASLPAASRPQPPASKPVASPAVTYPAPAPPASYP